MCPTMTNTPFLSQNVDPNRVVQLDEILKIFNLPNPGQESQVDNTKLLRSETHAVGSITPVFSVAEYC